MAISQPDKSRSRLFWTTVCAIIATVAGGVLVYYLTHHRDEPIVNYSYKKGDIFEVNYPSSLEGELQPFEWEKRCGCVIGAPFGDIKWYDVGLVIGLGNQYNRMVVVVGEKTDEIWKLVMRDKDELLNPKQGSYKVKLLTHADDKENETLYLEVKQGFLPQFYRIIRLESRDGYFLFAHTLTNKKTWKKSADQLRKAVRGIKWSPEAAKEAFLLEKNKTSQNEKGPYE